MTRRLAWYAHQVAVNAALAFFVFTLIEAVK